jgi:salicylate hydroxylase
MEEMLSAYATKPKQCNMIGWKGNHISHMDFHKYEKECGTPFWDFHRANLHKCLLDRAVELGAVLEVNARVKDVVTAADERTADVVLQDGSRRTADLVVGADGINSKCREILLGKEDPPILTGDLAYRLLLKTEEMMKDPDLRGFVEDPQVNYWMGPDAHAGMFNRSPDISSTDEGLYSKLRSTGWRTVQHGSARSRRYARRCLHTCRQCRGNASFI